jgi:uncharacterized protein (DUF952 family)
LERTIFHITTRLEWERALLEGAYTAPSLDSQGFIHCSYAHQLERVANKYYSGQAGLVILEINPKNLACPLKVEKAVDVEDDYPHIYGPVNLEAVVKVVDFTPSADLSFHIPAELL